MKKAVLFILLFLVASQNTAQSADQWSKSLSGSSQAADMDTNISTSWSAQDRMLSNYRRGAAVIRNSASTLTVLSGEIALPDSSVSTVRYRKNTSDVSVSWSDIDTGVEANATQYYVYGLADSDATTFTVKISTSSTAPSGATYYRKLGEFYNDSSGNITNAISYRSDNGADSRDLVKGWISLDESTATINNSYNVASVTDNGTGDFTITWTTAFADDDYAVAATWNGSGANRLHISSISTTAVRVLTDNTVGTSYDTNVYLIAAGDRV